MKETPLYLLGVLVVLIGLIPIAKNVFSTNLLEGNPYFFIVGGIWSVLLVVIFYSYKRDKDRTLPRRIHDS